MSVFYDHLVGLDELNQELLGFNLSVKDHYHLLNLADSALHHEILVVCLDSLPVEQHEYFLLQFDKEPNDPSLLALLREKDSAIEEKIRTKSAEVKTRIKSDLRKVKKN